MNASERNLLDESDRMTESMLVRLEDWELAYLRAAMLHEVEETLNASIGLMSSESETLNNTDVSTSPRQEAGVASGVSPTLQRRTKPRPSGRSNLACELLETAR